MIHSYPSIYNMGHAAIVDLLKGPVIVEEKVDGSQISFGIETALGGLVMRSKGAQLNMTAPEGMFDLAVASICSRVDKLEPGFIYRGEYLRAPHHNALTYDRVPNGHIILFDINSALETYLSPEQKREHAARLGLECVPVLYTGLVKDEGQFLALLETQSVLGGQKIEGVVIKPANYELFGRDKKVLMGKFVSEAFREVHQKTWKTEHQTPGQRDILLRLREAYSSPARWQKVVIHLREQGLIEGDPRDIGPLMKEHARDLESECVDEIKGKLWEWAWPQLRRMAGRGLPEWYKEQLLRKQFNTENEMLAEAILAETK